MCSGWPGRKRHLLWEWTGRGPGHIRADILWGRSSFQAYSGSRQDSDPCGCVTVSFLAVSRKSLSALPFHLFFSILCTNKVCPSPSGLLSLPIHPKQTLYILILATECFAWLWLRLPRFWMVLSASDWIWSNTFHFYLPVFLPNCWHLFCMFLRGFSFDTTRRFPWDVSQNEMEKNFKLQLNSTNVVTRIHKTKLKWQCHKKPRRSSA